MYELYEVTKQFRFEAAHSLPHLPEGHKCKRLHGHSYMIEVVCRGELDDRGFVIDYAEISAVVNPMIGKMDHQNLNEIFPFQTTAERLACFLYEMCVTAGLPVYQVKVFETATTCCIYPVT